MGSYLLSLLLSLTNNHSLYQACGILGATVMPHSLYLGSGIVQPRLLEYDRTHGIVPLANETSAEEEKEPYIPSLPAIKYCINYSMLELSICLLTFALFVNSAILITAGASLSHTASANEEADLFDIYALLTQSIGSAAGKTFALALLFSGISAGVVCTIAGQMVSEGALNWTCKPWIRRAVTRSLSVTPSIIIAGAVGKRGLSNALNGSQVALSIALPFVTAPLIYFTCRNRYMTVSPHRVVGGGGGDEEDRTEGESVGMKNHWITAGCAGVIWLLITALNVANLVLLGKGV